MAERYLIDTSGVIKYLNESLEPHALTFIDDIVDKESVISFITEIELQVWNPTDPKDLNIYKLFVAGSTIMGIDGDIIQQTIALRKEHKIKLPDALIVATAIVNKMTLIADNDKDFAKIKGLAYLNPAKIINR